MPLKNKPVAILYQAEKPPVINGASKPMKPGGYADSGADIAYALTKNKIPVITPVKNPDIYTDTDWVFPDTDSGISDALHMGAEVLWLNTVLFHGHPIEKYIGQGISVVGQQPDLVDRYDDKWVTNALLKAHQLPITQSRLISDPLAEIDITLPVVAKPVRGRGSQGVSLVKEKGELEETLQAMLDSGKFGNAIYVEEYLPGDEVTIAVMPPGTYFINGITYQYNDYWSLPPVRRFNHQNGIAPYSGTVAVVHNSIVPDKEELDSGKFGNLRKQCEKAARLVGAKAVIRIDCRADESGKYYLFDLNMKPNMSGASRPHRIDQDSLVALAAREIGWNFTDLVVNLLHQSWSI